MKTQKEINAAQRIKRKEDGNADTKKYEKTKKGFLMRKYHHMRGRIEGHSYYPGAYMWAGKELLPKDDFYNWAMANKDFHRLWNVWVKSGYERKLCPSVDRIESAIGYTIENMQFVTFSVNCKRGANNRHNKSSTLV
jgi:hypothetical protein